MMSDNPIKVDCELVDCMFHHMEADKPGKFFCKHKEKSRCLYAKPCPLYRLDWQKKAAHAQAHATVIKRRGI